MSIIKVNHLEGVEIKKIYVFKGNHTVDDSWKDENNVLIFSEKEREKIMRCALETLKEGLIAYLKKNGEISTTEFKDLTQASRKYTIPLMEYCDQSKITIRVGDKRMLRDKKG